MMPARARCRRRWQRNGLSRGSSSTSPRRRRSCKDAEESTRRSPSAARRAAREAGRPPALLLGSQQRWLDCLILAGTFPGPVRGLILEAPHVLVEGSWGRQHGECEDDLMRLPICPDARDAIMSTGDRTSWGEQDLARSSLSRLEHRILSAVDPRSDPRHSGRGG